MGASVSRLRRSQGPALLKTIRAGDAEKADAVLAAFPAAAGYCTLEGLSPLHVAAATRRADLLESLLVALRAARSSRAPKAARRAFSKAVNQKNVHGQTPLMLACRAGAADCVRLLLEAGADATLFDDLQQRTCLHYAAVHGWAEAIEALLEDESVVDTAEGQRQPMREALIPDSQGHHRYIDGREGFGLAPLHLAASHGHLAAVKALLKWGASLTVRCNTVFGTGGAQHWTPYSTPLHYAAAGGRARVVQAILQAAAERQRQDPHTVDIRLLQDFRGHRPYDVAARMGHRQLLWVLNPRVPLAALLLQQQQPALPAVPRLSALAAAALRRKLMVQLGQLREAATEALNNAADADAGGAGGFGGAAAAAVACTQSASAEAGAFEATRGGSRLGRGSRAGSREGSAHGGTAFGAAARGLSTAVLARLSGGAAPHLGCAGAAAAAAAPGPLCRHGSFSMGSRVRHTRHASDSGIGGGALHAFSAHAAAPPGGIGGSWHGSRRGGMAYASLFPTPQLLPQHSAGAASLADAVAASYVGCGTATSVTSVVGCPVCLDSRLEVAATPCGHGLCLECAIHLSAEQDSAGGGASATPPLCPLCRALTGGFRLL